MAKKDRRIKGRRSKIKPEQREKLAKAMEGNKNAVGNEGGRPPKYNKVIGQKIYNALLCMVPIVRICEILDIAETTFHAWKREIPEFSQLVYKGTHGIDHEISKSLALRAKGFKRKAVKPIKIKNKLGEDEIIDHPIVEYNPPDTRAIEIWMKNRANTKHSWSNLPDPDAPPPPPDIQINNIDLSKLDDETINRILKAINPGPAKGGAGTQTP